MKTPKVAINTCISTGGNIWVSGTYVRALEKFSVSILAIPVGLKYKQINEALKDCDGLLLTGGADIPPSLYQTRTHRKTSPAPKEKAWQDVRILKTAESLGMPVLGICAGMQLINVARGGTLIQDIPSCVVQPTEHSGRDVNHSVYFTSEDSRIKSIFGLNHNLKVNSRHHQAILELGEGLKITSRAEDGIAESIEDDGGRWTIGVQWHPEDLIDKPFHTRLFKDFTRAVAERFEKRYGRNKQH